MSVQCGSLAHTYDRFPYRVLRTKLTSFTGFYYQTERKIYTCFFPTVILPSAMTFVEGLVIHEDQHNRHTLLEH
jgi:hypothetical protein